MSERSDLYTRWREADDAVRAILKGAQSASVSSGTGSRSYTRANLSELRRERDGLARRIAAIDRQGRPNLRHVGIRYV